MPDSGWASGWDKVGSVAISVTVMVLLLWQNYRQQRRLDSTQDAFLKRVEADTAAKEHLTTAIQNMADNQNRLTAALQQIMFCRVPGCPWNAHFEEMKILPKLKHHNGQ